MNKAQPQSKQQQPTPANKSQDAKKQNPAQGQKPGKK